MNSKQFDINQQRIKAYYEAGLITENERKDRWTKLLKEWYATPRYW